MSTQTDLFPEAAPQERKAWRSAMGRVKQTRAHCERLFAEALDNPGPDEIDAVRYAFTLHAESLQAFNDAHHAYVEAVRAKKGT